MKKKKLQVTNKDWSINLEDPYYIENPDELLKAAVSAVRATGQGCYVNLVTPGELGDPEEGLIESIIQRLHNEGESFNTIRYVDQCGCGGHVIRVTK